MTDLGGEKKVPSGQTQTPGDGVRQIKTTNVFRALNFELYVKQNKPTMYIGLLSISICLGYIAYWNYSIDRSKFYTATKSDGTVVLHPKTSRWES